MTTLNYPTSIASWPPASPSEDAGYGQRTTSIATVSPDAGVRSLWGSSIDELLALLKRTPPHHAPDHDAPNQASIKAAITWLDRLRDRFPDAPPTMILPEPAGGLIIECRIRLDAGTECIFELTLYNDRRAEWTVYVDGKVMEMTPVPFNLNAP